MLFNSFEFIFALLPISVLVYFLASRVSGRLAVGWLVLVSLFFYAWWRPANVPLFLGSIFFNFGVAALLTAPQAKLPRKAVLIAGLVGNLGLLAVFKYWAFFIANLNHLPGVSLAVPTLDLPLGISFFTFTQIAYLIDIYRSPRSRHSLPVYMLFVSYYPHLLAGPILHHAEMLPQFANDANRKPRWDHLWRGLCLFGVGLSKKVLLADPLAVYANFGFEVIPHPSFLEAWLTSLAYFFQIYFDFSGYTDMAIGVALLMNIRLPLNFNSPYQALDIQDFWRRWHITLGRFFRDYVYIPLGGNRLGGNRTMLNLCGVALLSGLWHGAAWSFVAWGAVHGLAMSMHALWKRGGHQMPRALAWVCMFVFLNVAWVFFRASDLSRAGEILKGMVGLNGVTLFSQLEPALGFLGATGVRFQPLSILEVEKLGLFLVAAFGIAAFRWNSNQLVLLDRKIPFALVVIIAFLTVLSILNLHQMSEFIYFNF